MAAIHTRYVVPVGVVTAIVAFSSANRVGVDIHNEGPGSIRIRWGNDPTPTEGRLLREGKTLRIDSGQAVRSVDNWESPSGTGRAMSIGDYSGAGGRALDAPAIVQVVDLDNL